MLSDEHRYHTRLQQYWNGLRGNRPFPMENEVNPEELDDIWDSCFLISIDDVTRRVGYRYSYMGENLAEAYGGDLGSQDVSATLIATSASSMVEKFDEVVKQKKPVIDEAEFVNMKHIPIRYRTCILPLGTQDGQVTHLLGCMRWKMY
ncbi:MAG: PAS domain-containing protein [Rickettsiales bacterium]|nr:PAS domain-containing protein [Rickettsiales bacterium]